ncbi:hypothetical protein AVEN_10794-1 [Araneus ventricosus]|uniref:Uncharacterized protein n=1 Tax=Araneus ventricosus TaxID=182803 RepID=A0A4Y2DF96_ARAVE|nr:hypothetical protein AVEN_10794-1 [Araneus ventricosus]
MPRSGARSRQFDPWETSGEASLPHLLVGVRVVACGVVHHPLRRRRGHAELVFVLTTEKPTVGHNIGLKESEGEIYLGVEGEEEAQYSLKLGLHWDKCYTA